MAAMEQGSTQPETAASDDEEMHQPYLGQGTHGRRTHLAVCLACGLGLLLSLQGNAAESLLLPGGQNYRVVNLWDNSSV